MTVLLSLFGLMFVGSFVLDYQRGKSFRQSLFGGVDTLKRNLFIFLRTSISMMIFIGPLLLISMFAFPRLVGFDTIASFMIAVLSIGFAERIIGMIVAPLVRTFWHQRGTLMPLYLDAGLYIFLLSILIFEFLMNIPGVDIVSPIIAVFYAFALFYIRYLFSLLRFTLSKGVPSN